jgi:AcrR family transcriptional regulator
VQILEAARACIAEEGVERLTLRKVAERAAVSHATIAYYFHTRKELVDAALLETSEEFMEALRQRAPRRDPGALAELVELFLDPANPTARFVVQMIDAGLHDPELRRTHDEFIQFGRDDIEDSIRRGMQAGLFRADLDPQLAAAVMHAQLVWWETELAAGATSREMAQDAGRLMLKLLQPPDDRHVRAAGRGSRHRNGSTSPRLGSSTMEMIEDRLRSDSRLTPAAAATLSEVFRKLYLLATGVGEAKPVA